ncbi:MAG: L-threonylcarbamoyladenylate synthase [Oscillospiraceae bacterium]|jgi:L-threonylcarbamoyladenylate synthase|nr:L-threonylcarbamoyladenylate synthase [Oscillospiraceae bacterium]
MKTERLKADAHGLVRAAELLLAGEIVAIPTETVYGLAVNACLSEADLKLNALKGSPDAKPITRLASELPELPEAHEDALKLFERHATVIVPYSGGKLGFRKPGNKFALDLLEHLGLPLACTSANVSGGDPALTAEQVLQIFDGKIAAVAENGEYSEGIPSAVVDFTVNPPKILRQGGGLQGFQNS